MAASDYVPMLFKKSLASCGASTDEYFTGRWSARLAPLFAAFADIRSGERVLDVGCGTGVLSQAFAACKWDFGNGLPMLSLFWHAAEAVSPDAVARYCANKGKRPDYAGPEELAALWRDSGLSEVRTVALGIIMEFASFEDFWLPFLGGATALCIFARNLSETTQGAVRRSFARRCHQHLVLAGLLFLLALGLWPESSLTSSARPFSAM